MAGPGVFVKWLCPHGRRQDSQKRRFCRAAGNLDNQGRKPYNHFYIRYDKTKAGRSMYKYESIAKDIQNKIQIGVYQEDEKLPQELELCKQYGASRITVREALDLLVYRGLITRRRGAGTYVKAIAGKAADSGEFARSQQFGGFSRDMQGKKVCSKVHQFTLLRAPKEVAEKLKVPDTAFVCYICRTRIVEGKPHVVEYTYMPMGFITGITEEVIENSIYEYIEQVLKLKIKSAHRVVRADMPTQGRAGHKRRSHSGLRGGTDGLLR